MALSIDSTTNLNIVDQAESLTGWSFSGITKTATNTASREGTNCVGGQVALNTFGYAWFTRAAVNMTTAGNERVYVWVNSIGAGTFAQSGWMVVIGDGTNRRAYRVGGSDDVPFAVKGWYCLMLDTANLPTTYQQVSGASAPSLNAIVDFGFGIYNTVAPSGNALNVFVDVVRWGSGIIVTSGATDDISLADIAADDASGATGKAYGIIRQIQPGVYGVQGDILFGNTGGGSIDWKDSNAVVIFEDRVRGAGTNTKFKLSGQHSSSGTFSAELGIAVSSGDTESGRSGVIFISANPANQPIDFDFSNSEIEDVFLYGCIFTNMRGGTIAFSSNATNGISHHLSGCSFSGCAQVNTGITVVRNSTFAATGNTAGALLWNGSIDLKNSQFLGNTTGASVEHDTWNGLESGTATATDGTGVTLTDSAATFTGGNVSVNDIVYNETTGGYGTVTTITDATHLDCSAGLSTGGWTSTDVYSIATPIVYTNLTFSGNTVDVDNTTAPADLVAITKLGTSNPTTKSGFTVIQGAVSIKIIVSDKVGAPLDNVQTAVYLTSDRTEVLNTDTRIITAGSFVTGTKYTIVTVGTTDFTAIGAASNTIGVVFTATGAGSGTGTATDGVAETTYSGATPVEVEVRCRKASSGATKYINFSSVQTIASTSGLTLSATMVEDTKNNAEE